MKLEELLKNIFKFIGSIDYFKKQSYNTEKIYHVNYPDGYGHLIVPEFFRFQEEIIRIFAKTHKLSTEEIKPVIEDALMQVVYLIIQLDHLDKGFDIFIDSKIVDFFAKKIEDLVKKFTKKWRLLCFTSGLDIEGDEIIIGPIKIKKSEGFDEDIKLVDNYKSRYASLGRTGKKDESRSAFVSTLEEARKKTKTVLETTLQGFYYPYELTETIKDFINSIRFISVYLLSRGLFSSSVPAEEYNQYIVILDNQDLNKEGSIISVAPLVILNTFNHKITEKLLQNSKFNNLSLLLTDFLNYKRNHYVNRFYFATNWIFEMFLEDDIRFRFLKMCFALEALLGISRDQSFSISQEIGERVALLTSKSTQDAIDIVKTIKDVQTKRGNLVHGSSYRFGNEDHDLLYGLSAHVLNVYRQITSNHLGKLIKLKDGSAINNYWTNEKFKRIIR